MDPKDIPGAIKRGSLFVVLSNSAGRGDHHYVFSDVSQEMQSGVWAPIRKAMAREKGDN